MTWGAVAGGVASAVIGGVMSSKGGSGGGGSGSSQPEPWSAAKPYAKDIMQQAQDLYNQGSMNPLQMLGLQNQLGYWEQMAPGIVSGAQQAWGQMLDPWSVGPMQSALDIAQGMAGGAENPYAQKLMDMSRQQMTQAFQEGAMPAITQDAMTSGNIGSSRQGVAQGLASERFDRALADQQNQLAANFYAQNLGQQATGLQGLTNLTQLGFNQLGSGVSGASNLLGLGAMPGLQQYGIGGIYQQAPWENLNAYNAAISPYGSVGTATQGGPGVMQGIGGQLVGFGLNQLGNANWGNVFGGGGGIGGGGNFGVTTPSGFQV